MAMTTEQNEMMNQVIETTRNQIAELETAVRDVRGNGAFVLVLESESSVMSACKRLEGDRYNFAAMSIDVMLWTRDEAELMAKHFARNTATSSRPLKAKPMRAPDWFRHRLEQSRESLAFYLESMEKHSAK